MRQPLSTADATRRQVAATEAAIASSAGARGDQALKRRARPRTEPAGQVMTLRRVEGLCASADWSQSSVAVAGGGDLGERDASAGRVADLKKRSIDGPVLC